MSDDQRIRTRVRRAGVDDAAALVRLRAVMFDSAGIVAGDDSAPWRAAALDWFREQLAQPWRVAAFVVDDLNDGPVSAVSGMCHDGPPGPGTMSVVRGHVFSVATHPAHRHRGHARECMRRLLNWFREETTVEIIELKASPDGADLYAALGFLPCSDPTLRLDLDPRSR